MDLHREPSAKLVTLVSTGTAARLVETFGRLGAGMNKLRGVCKSERIINIKNKDRILKFKFVCKLTNFKLKN
jgi:hypothetical protein